MMIFFYVAVLSVEDKKDKDLLQLSDNFHPLCL